MRSRLAVVITRTATKQLQNPAVQKALGAIAAAAVDRFTTLSIQRLKRWERRLRKYDQVVDCEWWECPEKQLPEK